MIAFSRITGLMLMIVFGSQYAFLQLRDRGLKYEEKLLRQSKSYGFARVTRTQELNKLSPLVKPRYYLSVAGKHKNHTFYKSERVPPNLYYLFSVGSNIEIVIAIIEGMRPILHIRKNPLPYGETPRLLLGISFWAFATGCVLFCFGFFIGPLLGKIFAIASWTKPPRPKVSSERPS